MSNNYVGKLNVIALDSNLFIYFLAAHPEFGEATRSLFVNVEQTSLNACASELVFYEVLSHSNISDKEARLATDLLNELGVAYKPVTSLVLNSAARLRREYGCGAIDAIHIASAIQAKATHFVTNDRGVLKKRIPSIKLVSLDQASSL